MKNGSENGNKNDSENGNNNKKQWNNAEVLLWILSNKKIRFMLLKWCKKEETIIVMITLIKLQQDL